MSVGLNAQVLAFHLPDGAISTVTMPCTFTYSASGDKLIIDGSGTHIELQRDRILAMTYRSNRGDSNPATPATGASSTGPATRRIRATSYARGLFFNLGGASADNGDNRYGGHSVRPVLKN